MIKVTKEMITIKPLFGKSVIVKPDVGIAFKLLSENDHSRMVESRDYINVPVTICREHVADVMFNLVDNTWKIEWNDCATDWRFYNGLL